MSTIPGYENLTPAQKLDRSLSLPGMHGIVRGRVGNGTAVRLPNGEIDTDFQFTVTDARPTTRAPERVGTTLTLRVPGGCLPLGMCAGVEDAPQVAAGDDIFVFVHDQGILLGGNTATRLVASQSDDVFTVRGNVVYGQGSFAGYTEPANVFLAHFGQ
jgi:hypothetical protein